MSQDIKKSHLASLLLKRQPNERIFVCTEDNHYKVWIISVESGKIRLQWGRIGNKLQETIKKNTAWGSANSVEGLIQEKIAKGYKEASR